MKKCVVMGITGSIAAYKACDIVSRLKKRGVDVCVILTQAGKEFITPLTLETISGNPVATDMFHREAPWEVEHISLAKKADVFLVAPASANFLGKASAGMADDMLTTVLLATKAPVLIAPAMNSAMYENPAVQQNIKSLKARGFKFIEPASGLLACGDTGVGRLADIDTIVQKTMELLYPKQDLAGKKLLVTAGPTVEEIDPVRFISNRSSGKMGYAIAEAAQERGAEVVLVSGPTSLGAPHGVEKVDILSSKELCDAVVKYFPDCDALIMAAAPADFTPLSKAAGKIKKGGAGGITLELVATRDILKTVAGDKGNRKIMGFAAETDDIEANAKAKLFSKNLDFIAANDVSGGAIGFGSSDNAVTLYDQEGNKEESGVMPKRELAHWLLDRLFTTE